MALQMLIISSDPQNMKTFHFHQPASLALSLLAALAFSVNAWAGSSQHIYQSVQLIPTVDAPVDAGGTAALKAHEGEEASLAVSPTGLLSGTYNVSATLKSSGSSVLLGPVVVDGSNAVSVTFGTVTNPYPLGFNPYDVAEVMVSGSGLDLLNPLDDMVFLVGDFTDPVTSLKSRLHVNKPLVAPAPIMTGTDTVLPPTPEGRLVVNARFQKGQLRALINFYVRNLAPNTDYELAINGAPTGTTYTSDDKGRLFLKQTPGLGNSNGKSKGKEKGQSKGKHYLSSLNIFEIQSIALLDAVTGEVVIEGTL
jgi:hypothetical protein